ncbi:hypothetical protein C5O19_18490 [Siphonobacter curvatus]|uniref:Uncharacterized protein n=1 Tax=Siphonobacter curvatus TaxID=2094562 RepID=A0A2S7IJ33_9BACT|nr:hypothetical protein C5O19_18490 [Siphonobacter curvatus]
MIRYKALSDAGRLCLEAYITLTDYTTTLFDKYEEDIGGQSVCEQAEYPLKQTKSRCAYGKDELRARIYANVSRSEGIGAINIMQMLTR